MNKDIMICGIGGQGTVLASKIIAAAAMDEGHRAHSAETIGMAQRGGSVTSHIRIGEDAFSPLIPFGCASMLLAFEPGEAVRNLPYLDKNGMAIVNTLPTKPVTESLHETGYDGTEMIAYLENKCSCIFADSKELCKPFGSTRFFNIIMLGIAAGSGRLGIKKETLLKEIEQNVPARFADINREAFLTGFKIGQAHIKPANQGE